MTREEAIKWLEKMANGTRIVEYRKALSMAISALREQEERDGGCEYCNDGKSMYHRSSEIHNSMDEDVYISGNSLVVDIGCHSYGQVEINFCPMCGRRLHLPKPTPQKANS